MKLVAGGSVSGGVISVTIPEGCTAVIAFTSNGNQMDAAAGDSLPRVYLTPNPADTYSILEGGNSKSVLARANTNFPNIPVSAGETLFVIGAGLAYGFILYLAE